MFLGISKDGDSPPLWVTVPVFDSLFTPLMQKGFLAFNWIFPCHDSCLLPLVHVLGTSEKAQALLGRRISQMLALPASIQHSAKEGQLFSCPGTPRDLGGSCQGPEPFLVCSS